MGGRPRNEQQQPRDDSPLFTVILRPPKDDKDGGGRPRDVQQQPRDDSLPFLLSSYVCKRPPKLNVILRPPKDLAVFDIQTSTTYDHERPWLFVKTRKTRSLQRQNSQIRQISRDISKPWCKIVVIVIYFTFKYIL